MRKYFIYLSWIILGLYTNPVLSQNDGSCPIVGLAADIGDETLGPAVKQYLDEGLDPEKAWLLMFEGFGNRTRAFTKDVPTLSKVEDLMNNQPFKDGIGAIWENELKIIIEKNKDLFCDAAGTAAGRAASRPKLVEFLDDLEYFVQNFNINDGSYGEQFYRWSKRLSDDGTPLGNTNLLEEMFQTFFELRRRGLNAQDIASMGIEFTIGTKKYDALLVNGKFIEFKNVDFVTTALKNKTGYVNQLIDGYFRNVNSLEQFEWVVAFRKLKAKGLPSKPEALAHMKLQMKEVYEARGDDVFNSLWANPNLRNNLFQGLSNPQQARTIFNSYIDDVQSPLYNFIKVE